ncbi:putative prophage PSSB64-02, Orf58 [Pseudomonas coronafaciens pv. porri]|nr:putative prophage PSSB64-02, Orf58 [Pseudomonas coronafaciens pv. porri]RMU79643.1 putative prophage PSSB64-02, Orf58 [Pseudomonas coronafaciens pv. porri]
MEWASIEEQGEALTLMIHHLHSLGPRGALPMLEVPRHEITVSPVVARKLELAYEREKLRIVREA